jgi:chromosome segregation ATPase
MDPITLRLSRETIDVVDTEADDHDLRRAEYLRRIVENRHEHMRVRDEYETTLAEYEDRIDELETENERLNRERRQLLETREEKKELVRYAETQRELDTRREERQDAPVWRRAKWWVLGRSADA